MKEFGSIFEGASESSSVGGVQSSRNPLATKKVHPRAP